MQNFNMKNNNAHLKRFKTGRAKSLKRTNRKKISAAISENYLLMLQIYCLDKKEATMKSKLRYKGTTGRSVSPAVKRNHSLFAAIVSFVNEYLFLLKRGKTAMAMGRAINLQEV